MLVRDKKSVIFNNAFTSPDECLPLFEECFRQAYRGFIPDYDNLTGLESQFLGLLWDKFNVSHYSEQYQPGILLVSIGTMQFELICMGLYGNQLELTLVEFFIVDDFGFKL